MTSSLSLFRFNVSLVNINRSFRKSIEHPACNLYKQVLKLRRNYIPKKSLVIYTIDVFLPYAARDYLPEKEKKQYPKYRNINFCRNRTAGHGQEYHNVDFNTCF